MDKLTLNGTPVKLPVNLARVRIKAVAVGGVEGYRFHMIDMDTGKILPVMATNATIHYKVGEPITANVILVLDEIDIETDATITKQGVIDGSPNT